MYGDFASQEKRKSQENKSQVVLKLKSCSGFEIIWVGSVAFALMTLTAMMMMITMITMTRRPQVESWACECVVSRGTAKLTVHFKR